MSFLNAWDNCPLNLALLVIEITNDAWSNKFSEETIFLVALSNSVLGFVIYSAFLSDKKKSIALHNINSLQCICEGSGMSEGRFAIHKDIWTSI